MRFVADVMLGRLAKWLRILGYDVSDLRTPNPDSLIKQAREEGRVILTRNRRLTQEGQPVKVLLIESDHWRAQIAQVLKAFSLRPGQGRFRRCLLCNRRLVALGKEQVEGKVPDFVLLNYPSYLRCPGCGRIYWQGSHLSGMAQIVSELLAPPDASSNKEGDP
jgi:hypothetical protein